MKIRTNLIRRILKTNNDQKRIIFPTFLSSSSKVAALQVLQSPRFDLERFPGCAIRGFDVRTSRTTSCYADKWKAVRRSRLVRARTVAYMAGNTDPVVRFDIRMLETRRISSRFRGTRTCKAAGIVYRQCHKV